MNNVEKLMELISHEEKLHSELVEICKYSSYRLKKEKARHQFIMSGYLSALDDLKEKDSSF